MMVEIDKKVNSNLPAYTDHPVARHRKHKMIADFMQPEKGQNIDVKVVEDFGEEWSKFNAFDHHEIERMGNEYFDILPAELCRKHIRVLDMGCGTGRWTKYLSSRVGHIDAVDPSKAIFVADELLKDCENVRLTRAMSEALPFPDNAYDLVMSVGVLHHIPDTFKAMKDCVAKVKPGGYFYTYLYYNLDNRGFLFKVLFALSNVIRKTVASMPTKLKKMTCDLLAVVFYMPFVLLSRLFYNLGMKGVAEKLPLSYYRNKSFFVIRNDSLDRFGTSLEHRFSRKEIKEMLENCGLSDIRFSEHSPYWHVIAKR
jgi:ubiquinone/menaquinone biosynthesis C-methylase UbiE